MGDEVKFEESLWVDESHVTAKDSRQVGSINDEASLAVTSCV